jgi:hypothetical protein
MSALGHSRRLAWIDITRMVRKHTDWGNGASSAIGLVMYVVIFGASTLSGGYVAYRLGLLLADGSAGILEIGPFAPIEGIRGILALFWLTFTVVIVIRGVGQRGTLVQPEGILTVVPTSQAFLGVLLAEYVYFLLWLLAPGIGVGVGLAIGTGVVWPAILVPLGVAAAGLASVSVGYPLGLAIRHVATRFEFVARHKGAIVVVVFVGYFAVLSTGTLDRVMIQLFEPMQASPFGWFADLALLGTPLLGAATLYAGGAVVLSIGLGALSVIAGTRVAERHWFSDPALAGAEPPATTIEDAAPGFERRLATVFDGATAALIALSWRRARRSPMKLLYAFYPLLFLAGVFADIVQSGQVPAYLPYGILLFVAWAAGVIFTLNPLGDQGAALASTLLSRVDGRRFVRAIVLAGLVVAVPIGAIATAIVAVLSPIDPETAIVLVVASPIAMVVAAGLSIGIGMAFPRFEAVKVTQSMKTVLPSRWAFLLFSLHLFATAGAATVVSEGFARNFAAILISWALPFGWSIDPGVVYWVGLVALVPLLVAPIVSYRYAVRRFDRYTVA